jgi:hypothetical protein
MEAVAEAVVTTTPSDTNPRQAPGAHDRYAKCVEVSKRVRWEIERDVIRGRNFDFGKKFLPDGLSKVGDLSFVTPTSAAS